VIRIFALPLKSLPTLRY